MEATTPIILQYVQALTTDEFESNMMGIVTTLDVEEAFIRRFVSTRHRDRMLMLHKSKRRFRFLEYLAGSSYLDNKYAVAVPKKVLTGQLIKILCKLGAPNEVSVVSNGRYPQGVKKELPEAIEFAYYDGGTIIFCLNGKLACCIGEDGDPVFIVSDEVVALQKLMTTELECRNTP